MLQKLKRGWKPTTILLIVGFSISLTSVLIGISSINSIIRSLSEMDSETPIYLTMQNTGLSLALAIYVFSVANCLVVTNYWMITQRRDMAIRKAFGWSDLQLIVAIIAEMIKMLAVSLVISAVLLATLTAWNTTIFSLELTTLFHFRYSRPAPVYAVSIRADTDYTDFENPSCGGDFIMSAILKLALKEIRKKKFYTLLMSVVCLIAMHTVLTSITNATSAAYQQKIFERSLGMETERVLHLDYHQTEESPEFAATLADYRDYIAALPGVEAVGQFDATGMYFSELKASDAYKEINSEMVAGRKYNNYPGITQLLCVDEVILPLVKGGISEFTETASGKLPIYASEVFQNILPVGSLLTDERTGEVYEVAGYFEMGSKWVEEDDLIRFPIVPLDGWFIAPFSDENKSDIMTQLSSLHNTYVLLSENADKEYLKQEIADYSVQHGFKATANTLTEEYEIYRSETSTFTFRQAAIAVFISVMAISSIIAVFTTNTLLKRRQYGVLIANGLTQKDIVLCIATEITVIVFSSALLAWVIKWVDFQKSTDLFRDVLLTAHIQYTLPICLLIAVVLVVLATLIPAFKVFQYQPSELIGGNANGND